jgi:hypothetical protein
MENILGQITGPYVARALKTLPNPETVPADMIMEATIEVPVSVWCDSQRAA